VIGFFSGISSPAFSMETTETRYCGPPQRDAAGNIYRSYRVHAAFRKGVPCPSTGLTIGRCDGWQVDHVWPLASCGCDSVSNMQWLPVQIKACAGVFCKDRWERTVYQCKPEDR
jgi:hypothetical protein